MAPQVGGYTTVLRNTTLLCDSAISSNCSQTPGDERDCFLQLMAEVPRGITAPLVLESAAVQSPDAATSSGDTPPSDEEAAVGGAAAGAGKDRRIGLAAGIGGALGGLGGLLLLTGLVVVMYRRRRVRCSKCSGGLPGCFNLYTDSCKLYDPEEARRRAATDCKGACKCTTDGTDGKFCCKADKHDNNKGSRVRLMADSKGRTSSQPSSTDSNTLTPATATGGSAAARAASGSGAGSAAAAAAGSAGGGVARLLEQQRQLNAPTDVRLSVLLGAGSFGRVYSGVWRSRPCAVKILTHGPHETPVIERELQVSLACRHPNVVETMHFVRLDVTGAAARLQNARGGAGGAAGGGTTGGSSGSEDLFPTPGRTGSTANCNDVYETWLIQELCDGGALSSALYGGRPLSAMPEALPGVDVLGRPGGAGRGRRQVDLVAILSLALDISRGLAYLHNQGIVHGDLKAENVLLVTRGGADAPVSARSGRPDGGAAPPQRSASAAAAADCRAPGGDDDADADAARAVGDRSVTSVHRHCRYVAKVADFGLSRALDHGRTHQTTRNVGTITHMPPESLLGGQIRLATDVYAFGMIMWELYTGSRPYSGLTAGEVVHRVVAQGARPAFPRATPPAWQQLAAECWAQGPEQRPSFQQVERRLLAMLRESSGPAAADGDAAASAAGAGPVAAVAAAAAL
ncbi:hypothetical protein PLESTF_001237900 [Pleodorina starrii]|nr:hypothetical protein PLESTM_000380700 [Pleodorina starrii]GLC72346.1 hypothetical protein PLESTF_001237900 [Pleodorina starrii]